MQFHDIKNILPLELLLQDLRQILVRVSPQEIIDHLNVLINISKLLEIGQLEAYPLGAQLPKQKGQLREHFR